jgi:hypothetical protein
MPLYVGTNILMSSDSRIKKDIMDIDDEIALTQIRKIKPKTYKYICFYACFSRMYITR